MPIPLKIFSDDDPEPGRLWIGLPVVSSESDDSGPHTLAQPNIPNRLERIAAIEQRLRLGQAKAPQPEEK